MNIYRKIILQRSFKRQAHLLLRYSLEENMEEDDAYFDSNDLDDGPGFDDEEEEPAVVGGLQLKRCA
jgi:hypothetical protein